MGPRRYSRHTFTEAYTDAVGARVLTDPEPFRYQVFPDNRIVIVGDGETIFTIAAREFDGFERPEGLWWVIADFQPEPIHDPTVKLKAGSSLVIPSLRTIEEEIFHPRRRLEI